MLLSQNKCVLWRDITEVEEMLTGAKGTTQAPDFLWGWGGLRSPWRRDFFNVLRSWVEDLH